MQVFDSSLASLVYIKVEYIEHNNYAWRNETYRRPSYMLQYLYTNEPKSQYYIFVTLLMIIDTIVLDYNDIGINNLSTSADAVSFFYFGLISHTSINHSTNACWHTNQ